MGGVYLFFFFLMGGSVPGVMVLRVGVHANSTIHGAHA